MRRLRTEEGSTIMNIEHSLFLIMMMTTLIVVMVIVVVMVKIAVNSDFHHNHNHHQHHVEEGRILLCGLAPLRRPAKHLIAVSWARATLSYAHSNAIQCVHSCALYYNLQCVEALLR